MTNKNGKCPPHEYRQSGKPYKPILRHKLVAVRVSRVVRGQYVMVKRKEPRPVHGPLTQNWFCVRCAHETTSLAGAKA